MEISTAQASLEDGRRFGDQGLRPEISDDDFDQMSDDDFGRWLAGLTDGEGCFLIDKICRKFSYSYSCRFQIRLRADDVSVLRRSQRRLKMGNVRFDKCLRRRDVGNRNMCCVFTIGAKQDCLMLCDVFSRYPLFSKKSRDFAIWKIAVQQWCSSQDDYRWSIMRDLHDDIRSVRIYQDPDSEIMKLQQGSIMLPRQESTVGGWF